MIPEMDDVIAQAEQNLAGLYKTGVDLCIDWRTFSGLRSFLQNLINSPQFEQMSVDGLPVYERVKGIHNNLREVREKASDLVELNVSFSGVDIELILNLALNPEFKKYKRDTVPALTAKVRVLARQYEQKVLAS